MGPFRNLESPSGSKIIVDGQEILSFGGCSYLGLSKKPELINAGTEALQKYGMTAQMSRYYGFLREPNRAAEEAVKDFLETESAMYYSTGYLFGAIALTGLAEKYDIILLDEKAHYSLKDGAVLSGKPIFTFNHMDAKDLEQTLQENLEVGQRPLIATDGMFPTFGSIPPLKEYQKIAKQYDGWLVIDESHAFASIGPGGRGSAALCKLDKNHVVVGGSVGKGFSAFGGVAAGEASAIDAMRNASAARGSAAGMAASAAITAASIRYVSGHPEMVEKLKANTRRLKKGLKEMGLAVEENDSPISTFTLGTAQDMINLQQDLWKKGIFVGYTTYIGAGPEGAIRCAVFSDHEFEDIDRLISELKYYEGNN